MILSCPSCGARFKIAAEKLGSTGRTVRCSKCSHKWHAAPAEEDAAPTEAAAESPQQPDPETPPNADEMLSQHSTASPASDDGVQAFEESLRAGRYRPFDEPETETRRSSRGMVIGWLLLVLVLVGAAAGLWQFRTQVVAQVPQAAQLYRLAGIEVPVAGAGLELRDVTRTRRLVDGQSLLVIEGRIANTSEAEQEVPNLRVALYDAAGDEVAAWTFQAAQRTIPAGGETSFSTRQEDPPSTAREFALTFAKPDGQ